MGGLYRLSVGISLKDGTAPGFAALERNAKVAQEKTDALRKSLQALGSSFDPQHSLASQAKILEYTERQVALRKQLALTTDSDERNRITTELKALGLMKEQETLRKNQLSLQERLGKMQDAAAFQAQASQEKLNLQALRNQDVVAGVALRNQSIIAKAAYAAQVEQERVDLRNIKVVADAKKAALRDQARQQASVVSSYGLVGGMLAGAASSTVLGGLHEGLTSATQMEMAMVTLQAVTGANAFQLEGLRNAAFTIADQTAQSATDVVKNLAIMASSGLGDPKRIISLARPIAQFADVQFYSKGTSFKDSATQSIQMAHAFQAYSPEAIKPILEMLTKVSFAMPDSLARLQTQMGYYTSIFKGLGVSASDTIEAGALMDVAGLGKGKGGTALQNLTLNSMNSTALTKHVQTKRANALKLLGITDASGQNKFFSEVYNPQTKKYEAHYDVVGELKQISKSLKEMPKGLTAAEAKTWYGKQIMAVNAAFGLTGERAALALSPEAIKNFTDAMNRMGTSKTPMEDIQAKEMGTLEAQEQRFKSNLNSMLTDLMWPWLDQLRGGFKWMGDETHTFQAWAHTHKDAAKEIAGGLAAVGAALALYSGAQLWGVATSLSGLSKAVKILGTTSAVSGVEVAASEGTILGALTRLGPALAEFAIVAGTIAAVPKVWSFWGDLAKQHPDWVKHMGGDTNAAAYNHALSHPGSIPKAGLDWAEGTYRGVSRALAEHGGEFMAGITLNGNLIVQANDPKALVKALSVGASSATRHPVSKLNTNYSGLF